MPLFVLYVKADLENVASLKFPSTGRFCMDVQESAGTEVKEGIWVTSTEEHELNGSKGTANLVMKFAKGSKKEASVVVQEVKGLTREVTAEDDRKWVPIMGFDCRGLDPIKFHPTSPEWLVTGAGGKKFEDVDLSDKDGWCDYDDKGDCSVGVYNFEAEFRVHRG